MKIKRLAIEFYICKMLNIGLIGNTEILQPYVKRIQKNKKINIIGKSSVGSNDQLNSFHFSIPEFNRVELIERADIILIDNSSLLPFRLLCDIVKKSKHIFTTEYLNLSIEECSQLVKLANEAGSVIQVSNPFYFIPAMLWLNENISSPSFIDVSHFPASPKIGNNTLLPLLLMFLDLTGINPKKIGAVLFRSGQKESDFINVRLEFGDASVVNLNYGTIESLNEFKIKAYSPNQFVTIDFVNKSFTCNNKAIDLTNYPPESEFDIFIDTIINKTKIISSIEDYYFALRTIQKIDKKISQFSSL